MDKTAQNRPVYDMAMARDTTDPNLLREMVTHYIDTSLTQYAVSNPACPPDALKLVLDRGRNDLTSCMAIMNSNCPPESLDYALHNQNCPMELLREVLHNHPNVERIRELIVCNKNCPPEILGEEIMGQRRFANTAAMNPNCPPEILAKAVENFRENYAAEMIAGYAAHNPNCPPEVKIKWMRDTGRIRKEDPSKHIIDEVKDEEDKDLDEFKKLISKNNNWYKVAQADIAYVRSINDLGAFFVMFRAKSRFYSFQLGFPKIVNSIQKQARYSPGKAFNRAEDLAITAYEVTKDYPQRGSIIKEVDTTHLKDLKKRINELTNNRVEDDLAGLSAYELEETLDDFLAEQHNAGSNKLNKIAQSNSDMFDNEFIMAYRSKDPNELRKIWNKRKKENTGISLKIITIYFLTKAVRKIYWKKDIIV